MCGTMHYARCLRAAKPLYPGQAIITVPAASCFNYLVAAREMFDTPSHAFPLPMDWMNYNKRIEFLPSMCTHELATAGWMVRIASLQESPFAPYIDYLLEDSRGKEGVSNGVSREREQDSGLVDHYFSEMAVDACEEPEVFLERLFIAMAALYHRTQPIETAAIVHYMTGANFFKAKAAEMFVPTLMPLIDAVAQKEDMSHNTVVEYFPYKGPEALRAQYRELQLPFYEDDAKPLVQERQGGDSVVNTDCKLMDEERLRRGGGFFALRAMERLEPSDVLYVRQFPREGWDNSEQLMASQMMEANRSMYYEH
ncbi:hypothetical protein STCU_07873 [Strigomonas culicis]|nr:hypothetical protein STCU_07873 [Strigomonas culicis]|eukprot:EPY23092.1 hypothetical protein STCU_07873 [Strigomonas culicis]